MRLLLILTILIFGVNCGRKLRSCSIGGCKPKFSEKIPEIIKKPVEFTPKPGVLETPKEPCKNLICMVSNEKKKILLGL
ncbi:unnamed protein product [Caenorhabditis angaria]|uniref:Uncharacterized protein n=1 Tax=Caenorhabditis angaria TaxID=860376 RepID=A0A9P1IIL3_9PELO|nr:unnamed protein product [Caenorhabditis angaria]